MHNYKLITQNNKKEFKKNGYFIAKIFNKQFLNQLKSDLLSLHNSMNFNKDIHKNIFSALNSLKSEDLKKFASIMLKMPLLLEGSNNNKLIKHLIETTDIKNPIISHYPQIRTDYPEDKIYSQPAHQDWPYSQTSINSVTVWTPLQDTTEQNGALKAIKGSHKKGICKTAIQRNPRKFEIVETKNKVFQTIECKYGESIIFHQMLVHKSGANMSNNVRISFQNRYTDSRCKNWKNSGYFIADKNTYKIRKISS